MRETRDLEFKESITDSFLKTVSAYANYGGGQILFGVNDAGKAIGLSDVTDAALRIEGKINDTISPQPEYHIDVSSATGILTLTVNEGIHKPYYYRSRAYKRNDSSTVEVDALELSRLILAGTNRTYDEIPCHDQNLSFSELGRWVTEQMEVSELDADILKTLELCDPKGVYNNAAAIMSDSNSFSGIDMAVFGESISIIRSRKTVFGVSALLQYEAAMQLWEEHCTYEQISGATRETVEMVPQRAFREAVANALAHRTWDIDAHIRISIYPDRVEVSSPGGLPSGISEREYLSGRVSILRNPIIGNLMFRLHIIERYGTGVARIKECYQGQIVPPGFEVEENSILVVLPMISAAQELTDDEQVIYRCLRSNTMTSSTQVAAASGFGKTKALALLQHMNDKGIIRKSGAGRGTRYYL